ncbi:hypothetical protein TRFO_22053 [Tritrichomonas foetus]|uniref:C2 NT-type domain-containing protein n=1 Tax=Tritrichomonas foetus TaxID=1144522 RepID=A0A1J4KE71_9EUKA|nr:hypothetical protein TRFO_22053 [Tritrichomonas foetus]|eukprot:OHT09208.1 hypothetical protein TRFO_22053 [Tritrichomonas foetus]
MTRLHLRLLSASFYETVGLKDDEKLTVDISVFPQTDSPSTKKKYSNEFLKKQLSTACMTASYRDPLDQITRFIVTFKKRQILKDKIIGQATVIVNDFTPGIVESRDVPILKPFPNLKSSSKTSRFSRGFRKSSSANEKKDNNLSRKDLSSDSLSSIHSGSLDDIDRFDGKDLINEIGYISIQFHINKDKSLPFKPAGSITPSRSVSGPNNSPMFVLSGKEQLPSILSSGGGLFKDSDGSRSKNVSFADIETVCIPEPSRSKSYNDIDNAIPC